MSSTIRIGSVGASCVSSSNYWLDSSELAYISHVIGPTSHGEIRASAGYHMAKYPEGPCPQGPV